jgi:DTW domain-containing protein YfiP
LKPELAEQVRIFTRGVGRGKRRPQDPCPTCYLHRTLCICEVIPQLKLSTKVTLVIHARELPRTTNTGRLAIQALVNSEMRVRGQSRDPLDLSDLLVPEYRTFLFYPSEESLDLTPQLVAESEKPIQLIVPDGSWRQASKVPRRHHELKNIPRVMIKTPNTSEFHLREECSSHGMATLQAIAHALEVIHGEEAIRPLHALYEAKLRGTLIGRGVIKG